MPTNESGAEAEKLPTGKGTAGKPKTPPAADSTVPTPKVPKQLLDERQELIRPRRKPGGPVRQADSLPSDAVETAPSVLPTECAEPPEV
jgi:hypothetical protein